jgi:hypothetical protein
MTILPGGNESDFTLSLTALDRLLTLLEGQGLPLRIAIFIGDGHHDAMGIYRYLKAKGIMPIIPLKDTGAKPETGTTAETASQTAVSTPPKARSTPAPTQGSTAHTRQPRPHVEAYPNIAFDPDGTPLCPGGCRMRQHGYNKAKAAHFFACPALRKNGAGERIFYADECPFKTRCTPQDKAMGLTYYIKSEADLRLFPPIPRDSKRFKELYAHRSGTERENASADSYHLDRRHRNATFVLIRLTFVNIIKHARLREAERHPIGRATDQMHDALHQLGLTRLLPN